MNGTRRSKRQMDLQSATPLSIQHKPVQPKLLQEASQQQQQQQEE